MKVAYDDGYERYDEEEAADHIEVFPLSELFREKPVKAVDAEIAAKTEELKSINDSLEKANRAASQERASIQSELSKCKADLERWKSEHQHFIDLGRLLDGEPMFPLHAPKSPYHKGNQIPSVPDWKNVDFITVTPRVYRGEESWQCRRGDVGGGWTLRFFHSEQSRNDFVSGLFDETCQHFRDAPNFSTEGKTYSTRLDYGRLEAWCEEYEFLAIPSDIVTMKEEADRAASEKAIAEMEKKISEMRATK